MPSREDFEFLALLVHRDLLAKDAATAVIQASDSGSGSVDECLVSLGLFSSDRVHDLRRTRAGEIPDVPGHEVLEMLGSGGTSHVFKAREKTTGREVALKILKPELAADPEMRERFIAEGKLLMALDDPAIVKGYRIAHFTPRGGGDPVYLLSMELVDGKTLLEHLSARQTFDEDKALSIVVAVARALETMRAKGIVHRDIKPGNLMIDPRGGVKIIDLGFAQSGVARNASNGSGSPSASETTVGTVHYLSPEQARGESDLDVRSDIYSLGVTLFHLTVGELPFQGAAPSEVIRKHVLEGLSSPALKGRRISPHLHYFIEKMMAKEREIRYASPKELIHDIERTIAGKKSVEFRGRR